MESISHLYHSIYLRAFFVEGFLLGSDTQIAWPQLPQVIPLGGKPIKVSYILFRSDLNRNLRISHFPFQNLSFHVIHLHIPLLLKHILPFRKFISWQIYSWETHVVIIIWDEGEMLVDRTEAAGWGTRCEKQCTVDCVIFPNSSRFHSRM